MAAATWKTDNGVTTDVRVWFDATGWWTLPGTPTTPDQKLMDGYLDSNGNRLVFEPGQSFDWVNNAQPFVFMDNLDAWMAAENAASYDVIVYVDSDNNAGRLAEYWLQSLAETDSGPDEVEILADLTDHIFVSDEGNFDGTYSQVSPTATSQENASSGNYIVFSGLTAAQFLLNAQEVPTGFQYERAPVNAIQIIANPIPEPASLGLFGLGGLAILARRRRAC